MGGKKALINGQDYLGHTKEISDNDSRTIDELKNEIKKAFDLSDSDDFLVKLLDDDGTSNEL